MLKLTTFIVLTISISWLVFGSGLSQSSEEPDTRPEILETFIQELVERNQFNGNILVAEKGEVIYERSIGMRSPSPGDSLTLGSQFRLASACGPFTAMAVMTLQEAGLLDYGDLVDKYIPEWPYKGATIRNLLNETSGFPSFKQLFDMYWKPDLRDDDPNRIVEGNEQMIQMFIKHGPEPWAKPGEMYRHSSTDYILLATIVERVSGLPFYQYLREKVFLQAGMNNTYTFSPLREDPLTDRAYGLMESADGSGPILRDFDYMQAVDGFGIYSTLRDLYWFDRVLYTEQLVSQSNLSEAFTPGVLNNGEKTTTGFGWNLYWGNISADGYRNGFGVWINRDIEEQNCIIILSNRNINLWGGIIQGIRQILKGEGFELPLLDGTSLVGQALLAKGEEAARDLYTQLKNRPDEYDLGGVMGLQALAYFLSMEGYDSEATILLQLNTELYPEVAMVWNKLADKHCSLGDTIKAVANYEKALAIDTSSYHALDMLQLLGRR